MAKKRKRPPRNTASAGPRSAAGPDWAAFLQRHRWPVRISLAVAVPLLLLLLLEGGLRLAGYGYDTRLFLPVKGLASYGSNVEFGQRFFPRAIARKPLFVQFKEDKPQDTYRIFVLGASAAVGIPDATLGFWQILDVMLEETFPHADFETTNCALTAINSHVVLPIARECAGYDPDLFIIYLGNNEVIGPFNVGSSQERSQTSLGEIRRTLALRRTKVGQAIQGLGEAAISDKRLKSWGGMAMYSENILTEDDPALQTIYANYRRNLEDMIDAIAPSGADILLGTVAANLRDSAPFASVHRPDLSADGRAEFDRHLAEAEALMLAGDPEEALECYRRALAIDDQYADLHFRIGRALLAGGDVDGGRIHLLRALDLDGLRFRAGSATNGVVREVASAADYPQLKLFDAQLLVDQWCAANGTLPGSQIFFEHVHFNFSGNYLMARLLFDQVVPLLPASLTDGVAGRPEPPSPQACAAALALTPWNEYNMLSQMFVLVQQPPFTGQSNQTETLARVKQNMDHLKGIAGESDPASFIRAYEQALARRPDDLMLRLGFANLLKDLGQPQQSRREMDFIQLRLPGEIFGTTP